MFSFRHGAGYGGQLRRGLRGGRAPRAQGGGGSLFDGWIEGGTDRPERETDVRPYPQYQGATVVLACRDEAKAQDAALVINKCVRGQRWGLVRLAALPCLAYLNNASSKQCILMTPRKTPPPGGLIASASNSKSKSNSSRREKKKGLQLLPAPRSSLPLPPPAPSPASAGRRRPPRPWTWAPCAACGPLRARTAGAAGPCTCW